VGLVIEIMILLFYEAGMMCNSKEKNMNKIDKVVMRKTIRQLALIIK